MSFAEYTPDAFLNRTIGGYHLVRVLGTGSSGVVFLGEDATRHPAEVALKLCLPPLHFTPAERQVFLERFAREAEAVRHLHAPAIVPLLDSGTQDGMPYLIFPYLRAGTLAERLVTATTPLPFSTIVQITQRIAQALDVAHRESIIHRDIKSSNILFALPTDEVYPDAQATEPMAYLSDFGMVRLLNETHTTLTGQGDLIGTLEYMAPEQASGQPATSASDIYGLGIVVYEMITGRLPFQATTPIQMLAQVVQMLPPSPRQFRPDLPEAAEAALLRALAKEPAERFATAAAFAEALALGMQGQWMAEKPAPPDATGDDPITAETLMVAISPTLDQRRAPSLLAGLAAAAGLLLLAGLVVFALAGHSHAAAPNEKGSAPQATQVALTNATATKAATTPAMGTPGSPTTPSAHPSPTSVPQPTATPVPPQTLLYSFEDGAVWQKNGHQITSIVSSTDVAYAGTHSNEIKIASLTASTYPEAYGVDHFTIPNGAVFSVEVYKPSDPHIIMAQAYIVTQNGLFFNSGYLTLNDGGWTQLAFALPSQTYGQQTNQVGIQFFAKSGSYNGSLYVDQVLFTQ